MKSLKIISTDKFFFKHYSKSESDREKEERERQTDETDERGCLEVGYGQSFHKLVHSQKCPQLPRLSQVKVRSLKLYPGLQMGKGIEALQPK